MAALQQQYRKCGCPSCKCARGDLHGPYWYARWKEEGRWQVFYIGHVKKVSMATLQNMLREFERREAEGEAR